MKFSYVQIGAKDYRSLADFYVKALDFSPSGKTDWLPGKDGTVLRAPGFSEGSTAPMFGFVPAQEGVPAKINDTGYAHICFETTDVAGAVGRLLRYGGSIVSTMKHPKRHPCVYCADPEGNIVEFHIPFPSEKTVSEYLTAAGSILGLLHDSGIRHSGRPSGLKFIHVNMITADWEALCSFYKAVTDCEDFGKIKDHQGSYKSSVIGIPDVHVRGRHLLLKGFCRSFPTFEVFTYSVPGRAEPCDETARGIELIGFAADDPNAAAETIAAAGGHIFSAAPDTVLAGDIQSGRILLRKA